MSLTLLPNPPEAPGTDPDAPAFAQVVSVDGRLIRLDRFGAAGVTLTVGGRQPVSLDTFQLGALRGALRMLDLTPEPGQ